MSSLLSKTIFFLSLVTAGTFSQENPPQQVLCVDIGGTRVKAAVMHPGITLEELQTVSTIAFDSKEWLNEDLPALFSKDRQGSLHGRMGVSYDQVAIGVRGPVMDGAYCIVPKEHLPRKMKKECQKAAKCPVFVECDTGVWSHGALYWLNLIKQDLPFPCLGITLGTGIGVSLISSSEDITNIEISLIDAPFLRLLELSKQQPLKQEYGRPAPHDAIGLPYFNWAKTALPSDERIQDEFNARVVALIQDMDDYLFTILGVKIRSVMIGGGNSRFIQDLEKTTGRQIILLSPQNVSHYGVSFDTISLLGCLRLRDNPPVHMLPSWDEMLPWYTPDVGSGK